MRFLILLLTLSTLFSCEGNLDNGEVSAIDPEFFNLKEFVAEQKLKMAGTSITKTVSVNGVEETKTLNDVDWGLELAPFEQSNIDRPAMWDAYALDLSLTCGSLRTLTYNSLDSSNFTKLVKVVWSDTSVPYDSVSFVMIENGFNSFIADTEQRLFWWNGGYEITSKQEALLSEERELNIKGIWGTKTDNPCLKRSFF